jgi:hypothetical protein
MAEKWNIVVRQILLRGNFLAGDAAQVKTDYETALIADAQIRKSASEYPFTALADAILSAMTMIVQAIGENRESEYRAWFRDFTNDILTGDQVPTIGSFGGSRFGVISNVKDSADDTYLTFQPRGIIQAANRGGSRRKLEIYQYFSDDVVIEHTRPAVKAEIVSWDRELERLAILTTNNVSDCPLPDALLEDLEFGTLSFIYRDKFNMEQAVANWNKFYPEINRIAGKQMASADLPAKV